MKKAVLVLAVALMAVAMLATPVFAATKLPAVMTIKTAAVQNTAPEKTWTAGVTVHERGIIRTLAYDPVAQNVKLTIGDVTYVGSIYAVVDTMRNTETGVFTNHYHKWLITFPVQAGLPVEGAFEGTNMWTMGPLPGATPPISFVDHATLQGSGGFEGTTLKLAADFQLNKNLNFYGELIVK